MSESYQEYLQSSHWSQLRLKALHYHGKKCCCCRKSKADQVHHLQYRDLYSVTVKDLRPVCESCHESIHIILNRLPKKLSALSKWRKCCKRLKGYGGKVPKIKKGQSKIVQHQIKPMTRGHGKPIYFKPVENLQDRLEEITQFFSTTREEKESIIAKEESLILYKCPWE